MEGRSNLNEISTLLFEAKSELVLCLGKFAHETSEIEKKITYPSDVSGRLTKLQSIVGDYHSQSLSLAKLYEEITSRKYVRFNAFNFIYLISKLNHILDPIKDSRPPKFFFQKAVHNAIEKLTQIIFKLYSIEQDTRQKQAINIIKSSYDLDFAVKFFIPQNSKILLSFPDLLFSSLVTLSKSDLNIFEREIVFELIFLIFNLYHTACEIGVLDLFLNSIKMVNYNYYLEKNKFFANPNVLEALSTSQSIHTLLSQGNPQITIVDKILLIHTMSRLQLCPANYNLPLTEWALNNSIFAKLMLEKLFPKLTINQAIILLTIYFEKEKEPLVNEKKIIEIIESNSKLVSQIHENVYLLSLLENSPIGARVKNLYSKINVQEHKERPKVIELQVMVKSPVGNSLFKPVKLEIKIPEVKEKTPSPSLKNAVNIA